MDIKTAEEQIAEVLGKKYIELTSRGNKAIAKALKIASEMGFTRLIIPDMGGWLTYKTLGEKLKFSVEEMKTIDGVIDIEDLKKRLTATSVLIYCSMAGYFATQNSSMIYEVCKKEGTLVINDATATLGREVKGDIILASFGDGKLLDMGYGGAVAFDKFEMMEISMKLYDVNYDSNEFLAAFEKIIKTNVKEYIEARRRELFNLANLVKKDLARFYIVNKEYDGFNVIVAYENDDEKAEIIKYVVDKGYEYTECPREIRVKRKAISIEIKRKITQNT